MSNADELNLAAEHDKGHSVPCLRLLQKVEKQKAENPEKYIIDAAHFSDTGLNFGNTALIGHNRGRSNGFFIFVKDLQVGQTLTLEANGVTKAYVVSEMHKIHATDTDLLMHFGDSRLTLLTCWEGEKDYRRVIVAYEL